ncbi:hypothetical protein HDU67_002902 [Dinochytrium kinnereticum]|nr:hypothetical protein HDU67_002902 [Dinochytrium kinnereticum]
MSIFETVGLKKLEDHWPIVIASAVSWQLVWMFGWYFSEAFIPVFRGFNKKQKSDWSMRVVSFSHAALISYMALPILMDEELRNDPVFGYKHFAGNVYAVACGYFVWDSIYCLSDGDIGFIVHGVACLVVYTFSFKPFLQYYGAVFLITPFLNIHYYCDKSGLSGSTIQFVNGLILLGMFFGARICFGFYQSYNFYVSMIQNYDRIPFYLIAIFCVANVTLNSLNLFWFYRMILSVSKRFKPKSKIAKKDK